MIIIKNKAAIEKMAVTGKLLAEVFSLIPSLLKEGMSTLELDSLLEKELNKRALKSQAKGYHGYRHATCISLNDEVVHGVPCQNKILKDGDLVKVDICAAYDGYCADMARCFFIGKPLKEQLALVEAAEKSLMKGIESATIGARLSDISAAIQTEVERHGYGVVRDFAGHGIGASMHEAPEILNYGKPGRGPVLQHGMAFAIEPMITFGRYNVFVDNDGWTVKTVDGSYAAHIEDTVVITENGPQILTRNSFLKA